jgi:Protein of unknown function (DUF1269)
MSSADSKRLNECVVGVYDSIEKAESAHRALLGAGFTSDHVSLIRRHFDPEGETAAKLSLGDDSAREAAVGGALGGLAGAAGAATLLSITGIGLILLTGPIVTLTGAIVGAFLGAMRGWGIHDTHIREYEKLVEEGKVLLAVAGDSTEVEKAERLLRETKAAHVKLHARSSTDSPEIDDRRTKG